MINLSRQMSSSDHTYRYLSFQAQHEKVRPPISLCQDVCTYPAGVHLTTPMLRSCIVNRLNNLVYNTSISMFSMDEAWNSSTMLVYSPDSMRLLLLFFIVLGISAFT